MLLVINLNNYKKSCGGMDRRAKVHSIVRMKGSKGYRFTSKADKEDEQIL